MRSLCLQCLRSLCLHCLRHHIIKVCLAHHIIIMQHLTKLSHKHTRVSPNKFAARQEDGDKEEEEVKAVTSVAAVTMEAVTRVEAVTSAVTNEVKTATRACTTIYRLE